MTDTQMLDWLEAEAKKSFTGISLDYRERRFRYMRHHFIGEEAQDIRSAIKLAMRQRFGEEAIKQMEQPS